MWKDILKISTKDAINDGERYAPNDVAEGRDITRYLEGKLHRTEEHYDAQGESFSGFADNKDYVNLSNEGFYEWFKPLLFNKNNNTLEYYGDIRMDTDIRTDISLELRHIRYKRIEERVENLTDVKRVIADYLSEKEKAVEYWNKYKETSYHYVNY